MLLGNGVDKQLHHSRLFFSIQLILWMITKFRVKSVKDSDRTCHRKFPVLDFVLYSSLYCLRYLFNIIVKNRMGSNRTILILDKTVHRIIKVTLSMRIQKWRLKISHSHFNAVTEPRYRGCVLVSIVILRDSIL